MVIFSERDETLLNFLTPALLIIVGLLILNIGAVTLIIIHIFAVPVLIPDVTMTNIQINLAGQIVATLVTGFYLVSLFRVKKVKTQPPTLKRVILVLGLCCVGLTLSTFVSFTLWIVLTTLGIPVISSYGGIILGPQHLLNPWNLVLLFATGIFGAAIFEELIFRRMLIPALEFRGMAPTAAVVTSSLGFALIHVPNDVLNGSAGYVILHFITTVIIGLILGFVYVFTRNVVFPMIVHGFINGFAFGEIILITIDDVSLLVIYALVMLVIWFIAIVVAVYAAIQYFSATPHSWVDAFKQKSRINVFPGLAGYLVIAFGLVSLQTMVELFLPVIPDIFLLYAVLFLFYIGYFLVLIWTVKVTSYQMEKEPEVDTRMLYDKAEEVKLEPRPE